MFLPVDLASLSGVAVPVFEPFENRHLIAKHAKRVLRKQMQGVRNTMPASLLEAHSEAIGRGVMGLPAFERAATVCFCVPPQGHRGVQTARLADEAAKLGKLVVYPRVDFDAQRFEFRQASGAELEGCGLETAQAPRAAPSVSPDTVDLILVPVLAIDPAGHFIGDGSGTYDHVLQRMAHAISVAVAFEFQLIPEAPSTPDDVPVAVVLTERRVLEARGERSDEDVTVGASSTGRAVKEVRRAKQPDSVAGSIAGADGGSGRTRRRIGERT